MRGAQLGETRIGEILAVRERQTREVRTSGVETEQRRIYDRYIGGRLSNLWRRGYAFPFVERIFATFTVDVTNYRQICS